MATLSRTPPARRTANQVRLGARVRRVQAATVTRPGRDVMLAESKAREVRARRRLVISLARLEHAHAQAVRRLEEFDEYLRDVRGRLRHAGYWHVEVER
jgi:hypothetical protein